MRQSQRVALAKRLDKLAPSCDRQFSMAGLSRDQLAFLDAFHITLGMLFNPVDKYTYTLAADGSALVAKLFQITATAAANVDVIEQTDAPEIAQAKYRNWMG